MSAGIPRFTATVSAALTAFVALLIGGLVCASSSFAAPYADQATIAASTQTPAVGATLTVTGTGYGPVEQVDLTLHSAVYSLGAATTDASGNYSQQVTLPAGVSGVHEIVGTGATSGISLSTTITIGTTTVGSGDSGSDGLPNTGVAVIGIAGVGAILVLAGLMVMVGTRRKTRV